jgi:predicted secreted protein
MAGYRGWPVTLYIDSTACELAVTRISDVGGEADSVDITDQTSPNSTKEKLKGLRDSGRFTMEINARPADSADEAIQTSYANDEWETIGLLWPDGTYWEAEGGVVGYKVSGGVGEKLSGSVTIELSGEWDFDATAPTA